MTETGPLLDCAELPRICARLQADGVAALDTEFERTKTYFAQFALLQLAGADGRAELVDPLRCTDWSALSGLLEDADTPKLLHSCEEDVELLARVTGARPRNVFDTQVAAAFCGYGFSNGYNRLVEKVFGESLPKGAQRSDWMQRPLSVEQMQYARADVTHLPALHAHLAERLQGNGYTDWCAAECEQIVARRLDQSATFDCRQFRGAGSLSPRQLAALQLLGEWREQQAVALDRPRNWIARDEHLQALVEADPADAQSLRAIPALEKTRLRKQADAVLGMLQQARAMPLDACPVALRPPPAGETRRLTQELMGVVRARAEALNLPPELLAPRKRVQALVNGGYPDGPWQLPASLRGWREEAVGQLLLEKLQSTH